MVYFIIKYFAIFFRLGHNKMLLLKFAGFVPEWEFRSEKVVQKFKSLPPEQFDKAVEALHVASTALIKLGVHFSYEQICGLTFIEKAKILEVQDQIDRRRAVYWGRATKDDNERAEVIKDPIERQEDALQEALFEACCEVLQ